MPARIAICSPCAEGRCQGCTALAPGAEHDPTSYCVCRHDRAPRVAEPLRAPLPAVPTSAPFELDHALGQAREEGRSEGRQAGYLQGVAEAAERAQQLQARVDEMAATLAQLEAEGDRLARQGELLAVAVEAEAAGPALVLVELDANGGLVSVLAASWDLDAIAESAAAWEPPLPGAYVEAWPVGGAEPVTLPEVTR